MKTNRSLFLPTIMKCIHSKTDRYLLLKTVNIHTYISILASHIMLTTFSHTNVIQLKILFPTIKRTWAQIFPRLTPHCGSS